MSRLPCRHPLYRPRSLPTRFSPWSAGSAAFSRRPTAARGDGNNKNLDFALSESGNREVCLQEEVQARGERELVLGRLTLRDGVVARPKRNQDGGLDGG